MKIRTVLYADEGKILTDGEIYGKQIFLANGNSGLAFYEIDEKTYKQKLEEENKEANLNLT